MNIEAIKEANSEKREILRGLPIVAISGYTASGKETASNALTNEFGFHHIGTSSILRESLTKRGINPPYDRWVLGNESDFIHERRGHKHAISDIGLYKIARTHVTNRIPGAIIEGSRYVEEFQYLKQFSNVLLVWLDSPFELRFQRAVDRARESELISLDDFQQRDAFEARQMERMPEIADLRIDNTGEIDDIRKIIVPFVKDKFRI